MTKIKQLKSFLGNLNGFAWTSHVPAFDTMVKILKQNLVLAFSFLICK